MKYRLIIICFLALGLLSCEKESPLVVSVNIEGLSWRNEAAKGNTPYRLIVSSRSTDAAIRHIKIATFDLVRGDKLVADTILGDPVKSSELYVKYHTPMFEEKTVVNFSIDVYATDGEHVNTKMFLVVLPSDQKLPSFDGISLYSDLSGKASCFSLDTKTVFMKSDTASVKGFYFQDVAPSDSSDVLSCIWHSKDLSFAKAESFNFADATTTMVKNAYSSCQHTHTIQSLKNDDVLLFGTEDDALGVLKIMAVYDEPGKENDRYNFSIKIIQQTND